MSEAQSLLITCPKCHKQCRVNRDLAGKRVRCPNQACGSTIDVLEPVKVNIPPVVASVPPPNPGRQQDRHQAKLPERSIDIADQIQKLHQLHVSGALSAEEFARAKQAYLVQMIPSAPARQEEFVKTEAVHEEIVETEAVTRGKRREGPPPLPPQPASAPQVRYRAADFKDLYMKFLFKYLSVVSVSVVFGFIVAVNPRLARDHLVPYLVAVISGSIFITVVSGIFLYRAWAQIQDGRARTTPGKAVGFRFIPFFSLYWEFVAVKGLAEDIEHYARARNIFNEPISKSWTITYCILLIVAGLLSAVPILGPILLIPLAVVLLILFKKIADASAAIAEAKLAGVPGAGAAPVHDATVDKAVGIVTVASAGLAIVEKFIDTGHH